MVSDMARCCMDKKFILDIIELKDDNDLVVPYINAIDTTLFKNDYLQRDEIKLIQTPQLSNTKLLKEYLNTNIDYGDESSLFRANNAKIKYIQGKSKYLKLTTKEDLNKLDCLKKPSKQIFNGIGFDLHKLQKIGKVILGGIIVSEKIGIEAHSDGDVLIHSIIDALLGACGGGDIGEFFPDTDNKYKGISSVVLLEHIYSFISSVGYKIINIDTTIISQEVKIAPFKKQIRNNLASILCLSPNNINIKATTSEKIGSLGRNEGIAVLSSTNLKFRNWKK
jgi:2-C-methyl-D-erythritol 4-phosphate cytidylyltransferase/2-C-methyl-D-erythritol 2,4-cyclodiphosphate synthase